MLALQQSFTNIDKEIVSKIWKYCARDAKETAAVLQFITEKKLQHQYLTSLEQQKHVLKLFKRFGTKIAKMTILNTWDSCKEIYLDAMRKLREKEKSESKITREMSLYVLWNILNHPTNSKYRQVSGNALYSNLKRKCDQVDASIPQVMQSMEQNLREFGFKKGKDANWYYLKQIQLLV
ncbi:hypothetical protein RFI_23282, partial [Reticulomyxa filosa]